MTLLGKSLTVSHRQLNICKAFILRPCFVKNVLLELLIINAGFTYDKAVFKGFK